MQFDYLLNRGRSPKVPAPMLSALSHPSPGQCGRYGAEKLPTLGGGGRSWARSVSAACPASPALVDLTSPAQPPSDSRSRHRQGRVASNHRRPAPIASSAPFSALRAVPPGSVEVGLSRPCAARRIKWDLRRSGVDLAHLQTDASTETPVVLHMVSLPEHEFLFRCQACARETWPVAPSHWPTS
jgi:hypothetical protein